MPCPIPAQGLSVSRHLNFCPSDLGGLFLQTSCGSVSTAEFHPQNFAFVNGYVLDVSVV